VTNSDLLTNVNLSELMDYHESGGASATLCVHELTYQVPYGIVKCDGEDVTSLDEKPAHTELVNAGIYVLDPELLAHVPSEGGDYPLPDLIDGARSRGLKVRAYPIKDEWMDVGHLGEYEGIRQGSQFENQER
jgi:NDP-sugar pyrophosphorylase family protein